MRVAISLAGSLSVRLRVPPPWEIGQGLHALIYPDLCITQPATKCERTVALGTTA
jgi:hypothetical protein